MVDILTAEIAAVNFLSASSAVCFPTASPAVNLERYEFSALRLRFLWYTNNFHCKKDKPYQKNITLVAQDQPITKKHYYLICKKYGQNLPH